MGGNDPGGQMTRKIVRKVARDATVRLFRLRPEGTTAGTIEVEYGGEWWTAVKSDFDNCDTTASALRAELTEEGADGDVPL
jgi:hypothetical protein